MAVVACGVAAIAGVVIATRGDSRPQLAALRGNGQIVFARGGGFSNGGELWLMNADGSVMQRLAGHASRAAAPVWSPDGRWIAFYVESLPNWFVYFVRPDGSGLWHVLAGRTFNSGHEPSTGIAWAPTGSKLVFTTAKRMVVADPVHRHLRWLQVKGARNPSWSEDGKRIAFSERSGILTVVRADGRERRQVATHAADYAPAWSPDSERIAFVAARPGGGEQGVDVVSADGSRRIKLPRSQSGEIWGLPAWSPDGRKLSFAVGVNDWFFTSVRINTVRSDGKGAVTEIAPSGHAIDWDPAWSADGKWLYFLSNRDGRGELYVAAADGGGAARRLTSSGENGVHSFSLLRTHAVLRPPQTATVPAATTNVGQAGRMNLAKASITSLALDPANPRIIYAGTSAGLVAKSSDGGRTWHGTTIKHSDSIDSLALDPGRPNTVYAATYRGGVYRSNDAARTWERLAHCPSCKNGLLDLGGAYVVKLDPKQPQTLYVAAGRGVFKSSDGGENWAPANNGLSEDPEILSLAIDPRRPQTLYGGASSTSPTSESAPVFVYRSWNGGASWTRVGHVRGDIWSLALDPQQPSNLYAGTAGWNLASTTGGGGFKSDDGGKTWRSLPFHGDVTPLVVDPERPQVVYAVVTSHGRDHLKRSLDRGRSWHAFGPPLHAGVLHIAIAPRTHTLYLGTDGEGILMLRRDGSAVASWERSR